MKKKTRYLIYISGLDIFRVNTLKKARKYLSDPRLMLIQRDRETKSSLYSPIIYNKNGVKYGNRDK